MLAAAVALAFDMTSVLALMYPGRERVEIVASNGETYVYACKSGSDGVSPQVQAEKAQAAFEENVEKFAEVFVGKMMQDVSAGEPTLGTALAMNRRTSSWAWSITNHLEKTYGCALLG
ncbi:hypothetical protein [Tabrizicola sp.]|uniref:hypothetical protein n=1 Tax=Tabrizicola sp. TaxID=2005166 RepID=UPI002734B6C3|nr:hypothetical protein [Tabrizicola sp.]MDP3197004.1 hypothetical protein [Tabrizicola sp.]